MAGTETYHELPQPFRVQKRLILNQCFRKIGAGGFTEKINYVTLGGQDLYDVMDLVGVFDIRQHRFGVISYEENEQVVERARVCPVARSLSKLPTFSVQIVPTPFFENPAPLREVRSSGRFIYFLDDTKTFRETHANTLLALLRADLLRDGDWLLITSCLTPRVVRQASFMDQFDGTFRLFYGNDEAPDLDFKIRNHVDLLLALTFSRHESLRNLQHRVRPTLVAKYKYRDTQTEMGLWLFRIDSGGPLTRLTDVPFEPFLEEIDKLLTAKAPDIPNIFD
jgi:hypothetical protein